MTDIVEQLRLLQSGAAWQCAETANTLEDGADEIERLRKALRDLLVFCDEGLGLEDVPETIAARDALGRTP